MKRLGFLLLDGFALMSAAAAMEPFRIANLFADQQLYEIIPISPSRDVASSSLPASFQTISIRDNNEPLDAIFVIAGGNPLSVNNPELFSWLRDLDRSGTALGAVSGGAAILANAGLMKNYRFTIHWHHLDELKEQHPDLLLERRIFVIDRKRYTCAGGTAPLDMMYAIIASEHGKSFAQRISDWLIQTEIRVASAPQQGSLASRYGALPKVILEAYELMENHIADPLKLSQIAQLVGCSERHLQRLMNEAKGCSVMNAYRQLRLEVAHSLLTTSSLPIGEISEMTGFTSQALFADTYRKHFNETPRHTKQAAKLFGDQP